MFWIDRLSRHAGLVGRMADTLGIDFAEALEHGVLTPGGLRGAVINCAGCERTGECAGWLDAHSNGAEATPSYCRNKMVLNALARNR